MAVSADPDLTVTLSPERYAPRLARLAVGSIDSPSPDLRDATMLLVSSLVSRAVQVAGEEEHIQLRAWMPRQVVRVEVRGPEQMVSQFEDPSEVDVDLLAGLSDRWGIQAGRGAATAWFEIDRV